MRRRIAAAAGLLLACPHLAFAQTLPSIDAGTWRPSPDPQAGLVLEPAGTPGPWRWNVGLWTDYAYRPVVWRPNGNGIVALGHTIGADVVADIGLGRRAALGVDVPFFLWQEPGSSLPPGVVSGDAPAKTGIADIAITGKATVVSNDRDGLLAGPALAAVATLSLPTGNRSSFAGEGAITSSLRLLGEYALGVLSVHANIGYSVRTVRRSWPDAALGGVTFGDTIPWALGVAVRPKVFAPALDSDDRQVWELAFIGALPAGPVAPFGLGRAGASDLSPVLLALSDRIGLGRASTTDSFVIVGAEVGLDSAVGVPSFRVVASFGWAPRVRDRDGDGVPDDRDECPDLPEDKDGIQDEDGCPEDDADGDGILDTEDACPLVSGVPSSDRKANGCPPAASRP